MQVCIDFSRWTCPFSKSTKFSQMSQLTTKCKSQRVRLRYLVRRVGEPWHRQNTRSYCRTPCPTPRSAAATPQQSTATVKEGVASRISPRTLMARFLAPPTLPQRSTRAMHFCKAADSCQLIWAQILNINTALHYLTNITQYMYQPSNLKKLNYSP